MEMPPIIHTIVSKIYLDRRINEFIKKLKPESLQDDLKSHCICEIYRVAELHPGKIEALDSKDQLFAWFVGMAKMQLFSKRSTFYRKHRRCFDDDTLIDHNKADEQTEYEFDVVDKAKEEMAEWIYKELERPDRKTGKRWVHNTIFDATPILMF